MVTACHVADLLADQGKHSVSEDMFRVVLAAKTRVLGPDHVSTLATADRLCATLRSQGKSRAGAAVCRQTLATRARILGPTHPGKPAADLACHVRRVCLWPSRRALLPHRRRTRAPSAGAACPPCVCLSVCACVGGCV